MVRQCYSIGRVVALLTAALLFSSGTSLAAGHGGGGHGGGGHGGGGHGGGGHGGGGHGGGGHGGGGGFHNGGFHNGGFHNGGFHHHGFYPGFYGFGLGLGLGYGLGYPWYYGNYYTGGYYSPAYYDNGYDYAPPAYSPNYYPYAGAPATAATPYSYPSVAPVPDSSAVPNENAIYVRVQVPPDADVWFDGQKTSQKGPVRFFESPPVDPGRQYVYHIRARWNQDGSVVDQTREANVWAGDKFSIDFSKMGGRPEKAPPPRPKTNG